MSTHRAQHVSISASTKVFSVIRRISCPIRMHQMAARFCRRQVCIHSQSHNNVAHIHFHSPNHFLRGFLNITLLTLSMHMVKNTFFVFRNTSRHFEKSCFRMYLLFMFTNFEYHPAKLQNIYKTTLFE